MINLSRHLLLQHNPSNSDKNPKKCPHRKKNRKNPKYQSIGSQWFFSKKNYWDPMDWYLGFFRLFFLWGQFFEFLSEFDGLRCSRRWRDKLIKFGRIKSHYTKIIINAIVTHLCSKYTSYSLELWGELENSYNIQLNCCRIKNFGIDVKPWMNVLNIVYFQKKTIAIQWTDIQGFFNFFSEHANFRHIFRIWWVVLQ